MAEYLSHLQNDDGSGRTACGELWQQWQQPFDADLADFNQLADSPGDNPRPHLDRIRCCGACMNALKAFKV